MRALQKQSFQDVLTTLPGDGKCSVFSKHSICWDVLHIAELPRKLEVMGSLRMDCIVSEAFDVGIGRTHRIASDLQLPNNEKLTKAVSQCKRNH